MKTVKVKLEAQYNGHNVKQNGNVDLKFKIPYSDLTSCLKLLQLISCNIHLKTKLHNKDVIDLGSFYLNKMSIDREGESSLIFNTELDSTDLNAFTPLTEKDIIIKLYCSGVYEEEEDE